MTTIIDQYFERERALLDVLYDKWPVGQEVKGVNQDNISDINRSAVGKALRQFEALGILTKRMTFGDPDTGIKFGRQYHYTLLVPKSVAVEVVEASIRERQDQATTNREQGNKQGADARRGRPLGKKEVKPVAINVETPRVALAANETEEVRAIAGDDADTTLRIAFQSASRGRYPDESAALVEAARQYAGRSTALGSKIAELEAVAKSLGMTIDTEALKATVSFEPDPGLELVSHVLPYIDKLEKRVESLGQTIVEMRAKVQENEQLRNENRRLKAANERAIATRVAEQQAAAARA